MFLFAFRIAVSFILLFAAVSKLQVAPALLRGDSLLSNPVLLYAAVCVESGVAVWTLTAPAPLAWPVITGLFATLTVFASWAIVANRECNCFGDLLPTGASLPINIGIVVTMMLSRKKWGIGQRNAPPTSEPMMSKASASNPNRWLTQIFVPGFVSLVVACISGFVLHNTLSNQRETPNVRFLLADDWVGKSWPIDDHFNADLKVIKTGKWLAVIFRSDCEHCKALVQRIADTQKNGDVSDLKIVSFVAGSSVWPVHFGKASIDSESFIRIQWNGEEPFVASPAVFLLVNGDVVEAKDGEKADALVERVLDLPKTPRGDQ